MYRLLYQDGETPQTHTFTTGEVVIGRSPECQVVLKDFGISRQHARIVVDEDGVRIQDLKSKNGTQVNGVPVVEAPLKDGDRILLGKFQLAFSKTLEGKVVLDEAKPLSEEAGTIIRSVGELSQAPVRHRRRRAVARGREEDGPRRPGDREVQPHPEGPHQGRGDAHRGAPGGGGAAAGHGDRLRARARRPRVPDAQRGGLRQADPDGDQAPERASPRTRGRSASPRPSPTAS